MVTGKSLSIEGSGLRQKLVIAFSLMSVIPLLVILYLVMNYIFPYLEENMYQITAIVLLTLWISWMGYLVIRKIINPIITLALDTKAIAGGKYDLKVSGGGEDELGDIAEAVNAMTGKLRGCVGELQEYDQKTAELNIRIRKKIVSLSNLMKMGELISTGAKFEEVADLAAKNIAKEFKEGFCAIFMKENGKKYALKSFFNSSGKEVPAGAVGMQLPLYEKMFDRDEYLLMHSRSSEKPWHKDLREKTGLRNVVFFPVKLAKKIIGIIMFANFEENFEFDDDEAGVIRAFEKDLILGYQSAQVYEKVKSLEVVDGLTGLYTRKHLEDRLEDEINRAIFYQRPCSLIIMNIDNFGKYTKFFGVKKAEQTLKKVADFLSGLIMSPVGKISRFDYDEFGVLLPEKNKRESIEIAENICKQIEGMKISDDRYDKITVSVGVGENPIDGAKAEEIIEKAHQNMEKAKQQGKNQVVSE